MSATMPERIDPLRFAREGGVCHGWVPIASLPRLSRLLVNPCGQVEATLRGRRDTAGQDLIVISVAASLRMQCQRCLEPVSVTVQHESTLAIVPDDEVAAGLPDRYEPLLVHEPNMATIDMLEDELLLALPVIPRHQDKCSPPALGDEPEQAELVQSEEANPFAILKNLRGRPGK